MNSADNPDDFKLQSLLKRVKELQEIVSASKPKLSQEIPIGYTAARWQLALQSFNERLPALKARNFFSPRPKEPENLEEDSAAIDDDFEIEFGPEWDLKCAQKELEELLNKE
jgi:hypothetical protein